jgi:SET domain-containing protein
MVTLAGNPLSSFSAILVFSRPNCPMLLVKTYLDKSRIHGLGVFADEFIRKEAKVWCFVFGFDRFYNAKTFAKLPKPAKDYIKRYGYRWGREILFSADHDSYMNHSEEPNTYLKNGFAIARRNIRKGEEITYDYREFGEGFCAAFLKKPSRKRAKAAR